MPDEKPIRLSPHAERRALLRELDSGEVFQTLNAPDCILPGNPPRLIYQRRYWDRILKQEMLMRAVVEESPHERWVVTIYKTSKVEKYTRFPDEN